MRGYLNRPEETARPSSTAGCTPATSGYFDDDGYLTLVDRVKDMIIRGGENIYPKEIEAVLYGHPAVLEAAVVGGPTTVLGEEPVAFVALRASCDVTADELVEHCGCSLARFKVPRQIELLDSLPKNALGKIAKVPLARQAPPAADRPPHSKEDR